MDNQIATKDKKALTAIVITMLLIILLIAVCLFRLIKNDFEIMIDALLIGLSLIGIFFLVKEIIILIKYLKAPNVLIKYENNILIINEKEEILINDLVSIEKGANNSKLLFYQADLIINTKSKKYLISNVFEIDRVYEDLDQLIKKEETE